MSVRTYSPPTTPQTPDAKPQSKPNVREVFDNQSNNVSSYLHLKSGAACPRASFDGKQCLIEYMHAYHLQSVLRDLFHCLRCKSFVSENKVLFSLRHWPQQVL